MAYRSRRKNYRSSKKYSNSSAVSGHAKSSRRRKSLKMIVNSSGYKKFRDKKTGKLIFTHRRVAEKMVGGKIYPGREVHHIDGDKKNNRRSNLRIISKTEHRRIHRRKA